jgi:hypothetical protein
MISRLCTGRKSSTSWMIASTPAASPLLMRHDEIFEHRKAGGVAADQAGAIDRRGRGDQSVGDQDPMAVSLVAPVNR